MRAVGDVGCLLSHNIYAIQYINWWEATILERPMMLVVCEAEQNTSAAEKNKTHLTQLAKQSKGNGDKGVGQSSAAFSAPGQTYFS